MRYERRSYDDAANGERGSRANLRYVALRGRCSAGVIRREVPAAEQKKVFHVNSRRASRASPGYWGEVAARLLRLRPGTRACKGASKIGSLPIDVVGTLAAGAMEGKGSSPEYMRCPQTIGEMGVHVQ